MHLIVSFLARNRITIKNAFSELKKKKTLGIRDKGKELLSFWLAKASQLMKSCILSNLFDLYLKYYEKIVSVAHSQIEHLLCSWVNMVLDVTVQETCCYKL